MQVDVDLKATVGHSNLRLTHGTAEAALRVAMSDVRTRETNRAKAHTDRAFDQVRQARRVERTSRWKGLHVLVDALPRLRELVPDVHLDVVGGGDDVEALQKRAADLGVADLVRWHGPVGHADLPARYRRAGVTVLPSLTESESFGMTLAEALACGCPVVGSDVGGIPFVVRDGVDGRLVPPGDPVALADALADTITDPPAVEASRWDWQTRVAPTLGLLEEVAG